jgi:two-component system chemotaxis response regulator CheY
MKILVVDDTPSMRLVLTYMLDSLGYDDNDEAGSGSQAIKMLRAKHYDLLITDLHMPNTNGQQLLAKVRKDKVLSDLPVLMVSCEDDKNIIKKLIAQQVTGFMMKPFNLKILEKQLNFISKRNEPVTINLG